MFFLFIINGGVGVVISTRRGTWPPGSLFLGTYGFREFVSPPKGFGVASADDTGGTFILVIRSDNSFLGGGWSGIFIPFLSLTTVSHKYPTGMDNHVSDWSPIVYTARPVNDCPGKPILPCKCGESTSIILSPSGLEKNIYRKTSIVGRNRAGVTEPPPKPSH